MVSEELIKAMEVVSDEDQLLTDDEMIALSDMTQEEFDYFTEQWNKIDLTRRQQVICFLHDEADETAAYDFSRIYKYCLNDHDEDVRYEAVQSLWECEDTYLINKFSKMMMEDDSEDVREAAAESLGRFVLDTELNDLPFATFLENNLLSVYYNETEADRVRCMALVSAAPLSSPGIIKAIGDAQMKNDQSYTIAALTSMGRNLDDIWIQPVINYLDADDHEILIAAIKAAGDIESEEFLPHLTSLLIEKDEEVIYEVTVALGKIGGSGTKDILKSLRNSDSERVRNAAEEGIERIDDSISPLTFNYDIKKHNIN